MALHFDDLIKILLWSFYPGGIEKIGSSLVNIYVTASAPFIKMVKTVKMIVTLSRTRRRDRKDIYDIPLCNGLSIIY